MTTLEKYIIAFKTLKRGVTKYGLAPHKPIMLLTLIELIDRGNLQVNEFPVSSDLVGTFKENWQLLVSTAHQPDFTQPFYYLQNERAVGESYWTLVPNPGYLITSAISSVTRLSEVCAYGQLATDLFILLKNANNRLILKDILLQTYFSGQQIFFNQAKRNDEGYLHEQLADILNEQEAKTRHISSITEEDIFVRNELFKKLVPKIYYNQCSFTGMQVSSTFGHSFVDACHIIPFSLTHNDKVTNGIALCPNLHRAFDRGLVGIDEKYRIIVSGHILEDGQHAYSFGQLQGKPMILPKLQSHYPEPEYIGWHRDNIFKG